MGALALTLPADDLKKIRLKGKLKHMPSVIQIMGLGMDEDDITNCVLGGDTQVSIDAIDKACPTFASQCKPKPTSARTVG